MRYIELICRVASGLFDGPARVGVRLSPVHLEPEEAPELVELAFQTWGDRAFVAVAVPGAPEEEGPRWCISSGERAAEAATAWRNRVRTEAGERVLFVSATRLAKAGGLTDVLYALTEEQLREGFLEHGRTENETLGVVLDKLREAGLHQTASARALCEFAQEVRHAPPKDALRAAGQALPILDLAVDSSLHKDPVTRLKANQRLVNEAARAERKSHQPSEGTRQVQKALDSALKGGGGSTRALLQAVDLGTLATGDLAPKKVRKPTKRKTTRASGGASVRSEPPPPSAYPPRRATVPALTSDVTLPWTSDDQRREFGAPRRMPEGLRAHLAEAMGRGGEALLWAVTTDDLRGVAVAPPKGLAEPQQDELRSPLKPAVAALVGTWRRERAALITQLSAAVGEGWIEDLVDAPLAVLSRTGIREAARKLLAVAVALLEAAVGCDDQDLLSQILHLETLTFAGPGQDGNSESGLLILGPLHPLWLGQALARLDQLEEARHSAPIARRLIARSFQQAPVAPSLWPVAASERDLELSQQLHGLVTFESERREVDEAAQRRAVSLALSRLLDLHPHALLCPRITLRGRDTGPGVAGVSDAVANAAEALGDVIQAQIFMAGAAAGPGAEAGLERGLISLQPLPATAWPSDDVDPHLDIIVEATPEAPTGSRVEPGLPTLAASDVGGQTTFSLTPRGLVAHTPVAGIPALAVVERAIARLRAKPAVGAFLRERRLLDLASVFPRAPRSSCTWQVAVGARLSRRPRPGAWLLMHEEVEGADVAVVVSDLGAAARAIEEPLAAMGVYDRRPNTLRTIAECIAAQGRGGLLSLTSTNSRIFSSQVLAFFLRAVMGPDAIVAHIEGSQLRTIIGADGRDDLHAALAVGALVTPRGVRVRVGYANLSRPLQADVFSGTLGGALADRLSRVLHLIELTRDPSHGGFAAREALNWLLWSAVATEGVAADGLQEALAPGSGRALEVDGVHLLVAPGHQLLAADVSKLQAYPCSVEAADVPLLLRLVSAGYQKQATG